MNTTQFLTEVNYSLRGTDDDAPELGTAESNYWISTANRVRRGLYKNAANLQLRSAYAVLNVGTVSANATPSFDLDDTYIGAASAPYVVDSEDRRHELSLIQPQEAEGQSMAVYVAGIDPQVLYFANEITATENIVGGTLYLPAYSMPDDISTTSATATIVVEDADWLVAATAAEIAFNDLTYEDKAEGLNAKANSLYQQMTRTNRRGVSGSPRRSRYEMTNRLGQRHGN